MLEYSDEMIVFETDCCTGYKSYYGWDNEENEGDKDNDRQRTPKTQGNTPKAKEIKS